MSKADDDFIQLARARFDQAQEADSNQRQREKDDLAFYAGEQWDPAQKAARDGLQAGPNGLPPVPARPTLVINKVREPVRNVLNSEEQSEFSLELVAADDFGELVDPNPDNETEIELREGLIRRLQRTPEADDARQWAGSRAAIAGTGWYRVMTRFVSGKSWDKDIASERIYDQSSICADPSHEQPDGSDIEWLFDGCYLPIEKYIAEFGKRRGGVDGNPVSSAASDTGGAWDALQKEAPKWFTSDGKVRSVLVMNYWYTERVTRELCLLEDGSAVFKEDLPDDAVVVDTRRETEKQIKWAKIDGVQKLDETDWEGPDMPYVKVLGEELHPYDNERRVEGMVRPARDSGRGFNSFVSKFVETVGLSPIPTVMLQEGTQKGYEQWWQLAATRTLPYLIYGAKNNFGEPGQPPMTVPRETQIQDIALGLQIFDQAMKSTTGVPESSMGHQDPSVKSGKMAQALIAQSQLGTSHYLNNLRRSMRYEGQIINNLLYPIYGKRPGRLARIVTGDGDSKTVAIGQPPQAQPSQAPMPGGMQGPMPPAGAPMSRPQQASPKRYVLTEHANYNVVIKVTKNAGTLREQEANMMGSLIEAQPPLMTVLGDLFFKNQDGPGHKEAAERMRVMLDPKVQALLAQKDSGGPPIPPQFMQELQQTKQQLNDAHALLSKASQEIQSNAADYANKLQIAQLQIGSKDSNAAADREVKLAVAEIGAKVDRLALFMEERARLGIQDHEHVMGAMDRAHEVATQAVAQQHQVGMSGADAATAAGQQVSQQQHEAAQATQAQDAAAQAAQQQQESVDNAQ